MTLNHTETLSNYLQYLPANLQKEIFIGRFLLGFEKSLSGLASSPSEELFITAESENPPGIEEILDKTHLYFDPQTTPEEFLPWLASWVALSLRNDWTIELKRAFIARTVDLYSWRGTKYGLTETLRLYLTALGYKEEVEVYDNFINFPYYFQVQLTIEERDLEEYWRQVKIAQEIIDLAKPGHTFYTLKMLFATMQITLQPWVVHDLEEFIKEVDPPVELEAIVRLNPSGEGEIDEYLLNKITVQFQNDLPDFHLLTRRETIEEFLTIKINHTLYRQEQVSGLAVTIKNLNDVNIAGQLTVSYSTSSTLESPIFQQTQIFAEDFELPSASPDRILQMCKRDRAGNPATSSDETIPTIIGTSIPSRDEPIPTIIGTTTDRDAS